MLSASCTDTHRHTTCGYSAGRSLSVLTPAISCRYPWLPADSTNAAPYHNLPLKGIKQQRAVITLTEGIALPTSLHLSKEGSSVTQLWDWCRCDYLCFDLWTLLTFSCKIVFCQRSFDKLQQWFVSLNEKEDRGLWVLLGTWCSLQTWSTGFHSEYHMYF